MYHTRVEKLAAGYAWVSPFMWTFTAENLVNLDKPVPTRFFRGRGWCPARRHIDICEQAIEFGATHILILGSDQTYPEDLIPRLISRVEDDGCEVISAMVPARGRVPGMRMRPFQPMAWRFKTSGSPVVEPYRNYVDDADMMEVIDPANGPLQRVDFIGSGCLMFSVDHLLALRQPWFYETYDPLTYSRLASMDTTFVWRLHAEAGADVWVDTTIKIGHINPFITDDTYQYRFPDWKELGYGECAPQLSANAKEKQELSDQIATSLQTVSS